ncbi:MAG: biotin synthase BioB [Acidobacteriota bacterium]
MEPRHDWSRDEIAALFARPLLDLVFEAHTIHRRFHPARGVQLATLLSVKTGGCPEDCAYCPQSARYETGVAREELLPLDRVVAAAREAKAGGSTRFCMGGAYRDVPEGAPFQRVLAMVRAVRELGMEACLTMGMLTAEQARALADAGLSAYNHNLDTSERAYGSIITTRTYQDRLTTLRHVQEAGIAVCCGGIVGMGESTGDRIDLIHTLACLDPHPESVPLNLLVRVPGTPLGGAAGTGGGQAPPLKTHLTGREAHGTDRTGAGRSPALHTDVTGGEAHGTDRTGGGRSPAVRAGTTALPATVDPLDLVRMVAVTRVAIPAARIRLSAGRRDLGESDHALCFLAGANSIFAGDRLLTTPNVDHDHDAALLARLGLEPMTDGHARDLSIPS